MLVIEDCFLFFFESKVYKIFNWLLLICFQNYGNYVILLFNVICWLGQQVEVLGVEIFFGFLVVEVLYYEDGLVKGVVIGNLGINKEGEFIGDFQLGMELYVKYIFFVEGVCGYLGKQIIVKYKFDVGCDLQIYVIGIKELWEVKFEVYQFGLVVYIVGWLLVNDIYGGFFLYYLENNQVVVGYVVGLVYQNLYFLFFEEFQCYKIYLEICKFFEGGKCIFYGVCVIMVGGV